MPKYIRPFPACAKVGKVARGKHQGKYEQWSMCGSKNSLKRFAGIPFYIIKRTAEDTAGYAYTTREEAENDLAFWHCTIIEELTLTADQIVR